MERNGPDHRVRFGAMVAATAQAIGAVWPAFLIAWVARDLLESVVPALTAERVITLSHSFDLARFALSAVLGAGVAAVSGLLLRRLLEPRATDLRFDARLTGYIALIVASNLIEGSLALSWLLTIDMHSISLGAKAARSGLATLATIGLGLVYAALAFWPIGVLVGDRLPLSRAIRMMGQAYPSFLLAQILLSLPSILTTLLPIWTHHIHRSQFESIMRVAVSSLSTTVSTVILAQIYSRRLRGTDLATSSAGSTAPAGA